MPRRKKYRTSGHSANMWQFVNANVGTRLDTDDDVPTIDPPAPTDYVLDDAPTNYPSPDYTLADDPPALTDNVLDDAPANYPSPDYPLADEPSAGDPPVDEIGTAVAVETKSLVGDSLNDCDKLAKGLSVIHIIQKTLVCSLKANVMFICCTRCGEMILASFEDAHLFPMSRQTHIQSRASMLTTTCRKHGHNNIFATEPTKLSPKLIRYSRFHEIATRIVSRSVDLVMSGDAIAFEPVENLANQMTEDCMIMGVNTKDDIDLEKDQLLLPFLPGGFL